MSKKNEKRKRSANGVTQRYPGDKEQSDVYQRHAVRSLKSKIESVVACALAVIGRSRTWADIWQRSTLISAAMMRAMHDTDPAGLDPHSPGAKLDAGKPDASLLLSFGRALEAVAEIGTFSVECVGSVGVDVERGRLVGERIGGYER